jgi:hypothetical protein
MTTIITLAALTFWFGCGVLSAGMWNAFFRKNWLEDDGEQERRLDWNICRFFALFGPASLLVNFLLGAHREGFIWGARWP